MIRVWAILILFAVPSVRGDSVADQLTAAGIEEFTAACQAWDGARFAAATDMFYRAATNSTATVTNYYWLGVGHFHRMLHLQNCPGAATNRAAAEAGLDAAVDALTRAVKIDGRHAESHALLGTLYGMRIKGSLLRAAWYGPRVQSQRELALATGAKNPRVQYLLGVCQFHTAIKPAAWRETLKTLLAAEQLYQIECRIPAAPLEPRWGYGSCLTFIGRTCESLGQRPEAAGYYRQALALHPTDHWATEGLRRVTTIEGGRCE